ncbi:MAG: DUF1456 family protein [Mariprofundaceae bacterium]|nr:DUF1456 family protein [Mariprofundaceae bacterium]
MTHNDILRRIRYTFDFSDAKMTALFGLTGHTVSREQISIWLKKDTDPAYQACTDTELALFLNGLIIERRGKKEGPQAKAETRLNNNIIFRKLRIALSLKDNDILDILLLAGLRLSKPELSALFRKPEHKHYRACKDQILRYFLSGLQLKHRPDKHSPAKAHTKPESRSTTWPGPNTDKQAKPAFSWDSVSKKK